MTVRAAALAAALAAAPRVAAVPRVNGDAIGARGCAVNIHSGVTVNRRPALRSAYHLRAPDYYEKIDLDKFVAAEKNPAVIKK